MSQRKSIIAPPQTEMPSRVAIIFRAGGVLDHPPKDRRQGSVQASNNDLVSAPSNRGVHKMTLDANTAKIPSHVPPDLVKQYPLVFGGVTHEDPFKTMIPRVHQGPAVLFSTDVYPGHQPGWVFRRAKDLQQVYQDTEHFSNKDFAPFAKLVGDTWSQVPAETDPPMHNL